MPPGPASRRLFFALSLPEKHRRSLVQWRDSALGDARARPVPPTNLHLTLVFLGNLPEDRMPCIARAAQAAKVPEFQLQIDRTAYWPRNRILWAGTPAPPPQLLVLVSGLEQSLIACGHKPERRPFAAHITLARKVLAPSSLPPLTPLTWVVADFHLFESVPEPGGIRYVRLRTWNLQP